MIPDKPLNLRVEDFDLEAMEFLDSIEPGRIQFNIAKPLRHLLASASDWADNEVKRITIRDLPQVLQLITAALKGEEAKAVNPTSAASSATGRKRARKTSPAGP